jgi:SAM-dependent methyltransferase
MPVSRGKLIKRYLSNDCPAGAEYWDLRWRSAPIVVDVLARQADPRLVRKIERHLKPGALILEGGCGSGAYVAYFVSHGYRVIGIDFAPEVVERLNRACPQLDIRIGDVCALPFADGTFDAYYSGGVVEHFEEGMDRPLREAYRVLRPGGLFFVTVPHVNFVRLMSGWLLGDRLKQDLDGQQAWLKEGLTGARVDEAPGGFHFHEYVLSAGLMRRALREAGFTVIDEMSFSSRWGLLDLAPYRRLAGVGAPKRSIGHKLAAAPLRVVDWLERHPARLCELGATAVGVCCGNLRLYVAAKPPAEPGTGSAR